MKQTEIAHLLPGIFQRVIEPANPLAANLAVMEALQAADEDVLDHLERYFDPYRAPDSFIPFLSGWVDLDRLLPESPEELAQTLIDPFPPGLGRLRELIAAAAYLSKWRGTARGLLRFLETGTGVHWFVIDENVDKEGRRKAYHLLVHAPQATEPYTTLIERIIEYEKPAYATYDLVFLE